MEELLFALTPLQSLLWAAVECRPRCGSIRHKDRYRGEYQGSTVFVLPSTRTGTRFFDSPKTSSNA